MPAVFAALVLAVALAPASARAAEWDAIVPGKSTPDVVRRQLGEPSTRTTQKVEGYDTMQWVYEGARAQRGIKRVSVDFGLLTDRGFRAEIVRAITIEPVPGIFTRVNIERGWGVPQRIGKDGETPLFFYETGLIVMFDKEGETAERMIFTPPQPHRRD